MKKYYPKASVIKIYNIVGYLYVLLSIFLIIYQPAKNLDLLFQIGFNLVVIFVCYLQFFRSRRCNLVIMENSVDFNDGLLQRIRIPLDIIESIDYHSDLNFKLHIKNKRRTVIIPNVFSLVDQEDILLNMETFQSSIRINRLIKPDKLIRIDKSIGKGSFNE